MKMYIKILLLFALAICSCKENDSISTHVNTQHLDHLYQDITLNGQEAAIVYIYAEYPDYEPVLAPGEGIACVDDVARAAVFYLWHYRFTSTKESLHKAHRLINFLFALQAENGLFFNFIDQNYHIEKKIENSLPVPNWWAWRALWALSEANTTIRDTEPALADTLAERINRTLVHMTQYQLLNEQYDSVEGLMVPTWLPQKYAADQAAVIILALQPYYELYHDPRAIETIKLMADGILKMQYGGKDKFPYGAFLSWMNYWHAYGNSQAHALLLAYKATRQEKYRDAALNEIDNFYRWLMDEDYLNYFSVQSSDSVLELMDSAKFEQIAYGIRPMVFACLQAYELSRENKYARMAGELSSWLFGKNITGHPLYDPKTGRCFDGINSKEKINKNSGAESTIEALLTLLAVEQNDIAKNVLYEYINSRKKN